MRRPGKQRIACFARVSSSQPRPFAPTLLDSDFDVTGFYFARESIWQTATHEQLRRICAAV